tara:strand:+ start:2003 stop:4465 length:2463 start_codon:yes stop_codon:yes gene_type:complete
MTNSTTFPGTVTASGFTGTATNATNAVLATDDTNASRPVIFGTGTTGNVPLKTDPGIVYNPSTNKLTAGAFVGDGSELTGISAGFDADVSKIAIGTGAGTNSQGAQGIAIGLNAGSASQGISSVAIGYDAAKSSQGNNSISIGTRATGSVGTGTQCIAIGYEAANGSTTQGTNGIALGQGSGWNNQGTAAIAIGKYSGNQNQGTHATAVGEETGVTSQGSYATAVGYRAGYQGQGNYGAAIGYQAACQGQDVYGIAIGAVAGQDNQGEFAIAIGADAGRNQQGIFAVSIGTATSLAAQGNESVAIGREAGRFSQGGRAIAIGGYAAQYTPSSYSIAIGYQAARYNQGTHSVAIGYYAGLSNQPGASFYLSPNSIRNANGSNYLKYNHSSGEMSYTSSDDRVKDDETFITGAVKTLSKLKPQNYLKRTKLDPYAPEQNWNLESGLMAQEVYYSVPEMRHLVSVPDEAGDVDNFTPPPSDDPSQDPDYSVWGDGIATVDYMQMVPYLVKGVQEIVTELPRSKTTVSNTWGQNITGLVVSANTNKHKTNTVPMVNLSNVSMDKSWYGVVSNEKTDSIDYDTLVDTKGDSRIWVTDLGGTLESGDLLTTSNVSPGYAQKQEGGALMNYTVGKVTQDCDFTEPLQISIKIPKRELSNVTYYIHDESREIGINDYERISTINTRVEEIPMYFKEVTHDYIGFGTKNDKYYQGDTEISLLKYEALPDDVIKSVKCINEVSVEEYNTLDDERKATYSLGTHKKYIHVQFSKSKKQIPQHDEVRIIEELVDVLDENGQTVWEETSNTVPVYTLVDHETYKAAYVSCKLI